MKIQISRLDRKFSLYIRTRANWTCERCGGRYTPPTNALHCSHFWGRARKKVRFDPDNAFAHCYGCHAYLGAHPEEFRRWAMSKLGIDRYNALMLRANTLSSKPDYDLIEIWLDQELKKQVITKKTRAN